MDDRIVEAVSGFAKTMGLDNLKVPDSGIVEFCFEEQGDFYIEIMTGGVAFYMMQELNEYEKNDKLEKALSLCHYRQNRRYDVQSALYESTRLLFLVWLDNKRITIPEIEAVLQYIVRLYEKLK